MNSTAAREEAKSRTAVDLYISIHLAETCTVGLWPALWAQASTFLTTLSCLLQHASKLQHEEGVLLLPTLLHCVWETTRRGTNATYRNIEKRHRLNGKN